MGLIVSVILVGAVVFGVIAVKVKLITDMRNASDEDNVTDSTVK